MTTEQLAKIPSSVIVIAAKAMHDRGREIGWFALEWERLPEDSKERYETLASAAIAQLWNARDKQRTELRNALYPGGIKHPQQAEWPWLIERAKEQREALVTLWKAAYEHWNRTESCGRCCNLDSLDKLSNVLDDVLPLVKEKV